jgi:hypothetical protein
VITALGRLDEASIHPGTLRSTTDLVA